MPNTTSMAGLCMAETRMSIIIIQNLHSMSLRSVVYDKLCHDGVIKEWLGEDDFKHGFHL